MSQAPKPTINFEPVFECVLTRRVLMSVPVYYAIGRHIYPDGLGSDPARTLIQAAQAVAKETNRPPGSIQVCMQRVARWLDEGKLTEEQFSDCTDYVLSAESLEQPEDAVLIAEAAAPLRRAYETLHLSKAAALHGSGASIATALETARIEIDRIGSDEDAIEELSSANDPITHMLAALNLSRVSSGSPELDALFGGGLVTPGLYGVAANGAGGKSQSLIQAFSASVARGDGTAGFTLELPQPWWMSRTVANLCRIKQDFISEPGHRFHAQAVKLLRERYEQIAPMLGQWSIQWLAAPRVEDVIRAARDWEQKRGVKLKTLIVDYVDLCADPPSTGSDYTAAKHNWRALHKFAHTENVLVCTASQSTRGNKDRTIVTKNDLADSQHKHRIMDGGWSINGSEDEATGQLMATYHQFKNRFGRSEITGTPIPTEFEFGRATRAAYPLPLFPAWTGPET
mgnify:CR=1 FL=1